jgi:uncharacterized membrane protein
MMVMVWIAGFVIAAFFTMDTHRIMHAVLFGPQA